MPLSKTNRLFNQKNSHGHHAGNVKKDNFERIVSDATQSMSASRQKFSSFIHIKNVSSFSDFLGRTIARPNPIFFGAVISFSFSLISYLVSKNLGYSLSGFESIGAFAVGWALGLGYDLIRSVFKKK